MLLINNLTIDEINAALIALQKYTGNKTVEKVKETTTESSEDVQALTIALNNMRNSVAANSQGIEYLNRQIIMLSQMSITGITEITFDDVQRQLSIIMTNGNIFTCNIPNDVISLNLDSATNELSLSYGNQTVSIALPYINADEKGVANGVATLDSTGRVPYSQMPESAMELKGLWDASTNTPTLADGTGSMGDFYIVSEGGVVNFGHGDITFYENDRVIYIDGEWERLAAGTVISVNGKIGAVELDAEDIPYDAEQNVKQKIEDTDESVAVLGGKTVSSVFFDTPNRMLYLYLEDGTAINTVIPEGQVITENYIYDPTDPAHRLKIDANGITSQNNTGTEESPHWEDSGTVGLDRFGNIILNNSDKVIDYGFQVEGTIYHFNNALHPDYDEEDTNPKNIVTQGQVVPTVDKDPIIMPVSSPSCFEGKVTKELTESLRFVVLSKAEGVVLGEKIVKTDGTVENYNDTSAYNDAMRETSTIDDTMTVGEYLGLSAQQVTDGIFN